MDEGAQVRVAGPSRAVLAVATGALVAVTSAATAFVLLTGTGGVVRPGGPLEPLPPAAAPPAGPPVVVLPPGALGSEVPPGRSAASAPGSSVGTSTGTSPFVLAAPPSAAGLGVLLPGVSAPSDPVAGAAPADPVQQGARSATGPGRGAGKAGKDPKDRKDPKSSRAAGEQAPAPASDLLGLRAPGPAAQRTGLADLRPHDLLRGDQRRRAVPAVPAVPASVTGDRAIPAVPAVPAARQKPQRAAAPADDQKRSGTQEKKKAGDKKKAAEQKKAGQNKSGKKKKSARRSAGRGGGPRP